MVSRPLIFGEVLFDRFPDGNAVLGGAPFNVAWHLQGFGFSPLMITRLGDDEPGRRILRAMERWGLDTSGVQRDPSHPTGAVDVTFEADHHTFEILDDQAYDFVDVDAALRTASSIETALLYHGTLAARAPSSRAALDRLLAIDGLDVFVDVNLRDPFWRADELPELVGRARWCKINDDEVRIVSDSLNVVPAYLEQQAELLQRRFDIELMIVTRGGEGAFARFAGGTVATVTPEVTIDVVDTVGAGDAFASVVLAGILSKWPLETTLRRAQRFASAICGVRGATVSNKAFYNMHKEHWSVL